MKPEAEYRFSVDTTRDHLIHEKNKGTTESDEKRKQNPYGEWKSEQQFELWKNELDGILMEQNYY